MERLKGNRAIGHNRYSTAGGPNLRNVQPLFAEFAGGGFAVAHNGNLTNARTLQRKLQRRGSIFQSTSDTETIIHLIATSDRGPLVERMVDALRQIEGAFSLVALSEKKMIGCRDPLGVRPLMLGDLDGAPVLASETCALDIIGARLVREVEPGELLIITDRGIEARRPFDPTPSRSCIFEHVYFARPDSIIQGTSVYEVRKRSGPNWPASPGLRATSSCQSPIPACRLRSVTRKPRACRSTSALSAITMSAAPSFSPLTRFAIWA
jgi:amidophosphoribosyltransferase